MSVIYCFGCDKHIDTDFEAAFGPPKGLNVKYPEDQEKCTDCAMEAGWIAKDDYYIEGLLDE